METAPPVPGSRATPTCNRRRGAQDGVPTPVGCPAAHAAPVACEKERGIGEVEPPSRLGECPGAAGTTCGLRVRGPPGHMGATPPPLDPAPPPLACRLRVQVGEGVLFPRPPPLRGGIGRGREALHGGGPHAKGSACCPSIRADPRRALERVRDHAPIRLPCPQGATRGG